MNSSRQASFYIRIFLKYNLYNLPRKNTLSHKRKWKTRSLLRLVRNWPTKLIQNSFEGNSLNFSFVPESVVKSIIFSKSINVSLRTLSDFSATSVFRWTQFGKRCYIYVCNLAFLKKACENHFMRTFPNSWNHPPIFCH